MGSLVLKKFVEAGFAGAVVRGCGHAEALVLVAQAVPGALEQGELCEHLEAGNVFLGLLRKEGPNSADVVHVPGAGKPEEGGADHRVKALQKMTRPRRL